MKSGNMLKKIYVTLIVLGLSTAFMGCNRIPPGTTGSVMIGSETLEAVNAGIVKTEGNKTTIQIKCNLCGFVSDPIVIDTPGPDKPYSLEWKCPKCGHKQTIVVQIKKQ